MIKRTSEDEPIWKQFLHNFKQIESFYLAVKYNMFIMCWTLRTSHICQQNSILTFFADAKSNYIFFLFLS